ncbi:MAG: M6 family metalloprotease domain-containing protein [Gemmatimonadales bacterium]|nr:M6 family metalloprotease domain-containing protein [Gemmatimonadales bacterium]NIN13295.1 M6 family metalloprotease domain-containing protein [Gemmatimonadales bacterium]NIN51298.1 M6 family metalloprotease domain-containing protein [Gemmatimonadales bacterium]NIP08762.1 M6 family metalloprotease domain-containing protein [Gemmatimonadales bacterium]NIQ99756.1 M6 family metalloprotease domain-containing protein [Gemmatimonadales bacterium]
MVKIENLFVTSMYTRLTAAQSRLACRRWSTLITLGVLLPLSAPVAAQTDVEMHGRIHGAVPPPGYYEILRRDPRAFRFSPENGWIRRARAIAARRRLWRAQRANRALFAPQANFNANGILRGELDVPVFLVLFANTDSAALVANVSRGTMESRLYGTHSAPPYSIHNYYREISNDSLVVNGRVFEWTRVTSNDAFYEGGPDCNGLCGSARVGDLIREAVLAQDSVDYGQFDNDGPDGVPNSGDDDGYVDGVVVMHPKVDGACKFVNPDAQNSIWAHKWFVSGLETDDTANSVTAGFPNIRIRDYIIQGGQGGDGGCTSNQPQAMGLVAHETGHLFGLPDLYNTNQSRPSEGIGHWGLMGSGNWLRPFSPAHMSAWTRAELGWVTEVLIDRDTTLEISPVETADTVYLLPVQGSDEYFILANRQRIGSDVEMAGPGLLIWHVDSVLLAQRMPISVNAADPEALRLMQADGADHLHAGDNRSDAGDPFPGSTGNTAFTELSNPSSDRNDGTPTYVRVESIEQVTPGGPVRAGISFVGPTVIVATDTLAAFRLDDVTYNKFEAILQGGSQHQLEMDSVQVVNNGGNRYTWLSWSSGAARSHTFMATARGDSIVATVATEYLAQVTLAGTGGGSVEATPALDVEAGAFIAQDSGLTLVANVTQGGDLFEGWSGDTTTTSDTLRLVMIRPYRLTATFAAPLAVVSTSPPAAVMGTAYQHALSAAGGTGNFSWTLTGGTLPEGVSLDPTGALAGTPAETGSFSFGVRVTSGSQQADGSLVLQVTAPTLAAIGVVEHLLGRRATLSAEDITFLDLLGNRNGMLDVGDFLAWVRSTPSAASSAVLGRVLNAKPKERP